MSEEEVETDEEAVTGKSGANPTVSAAAIIWRHSVWSSTSVSTEAAGTLGTECRRTVSVREEEGVRRRLVEGGCLRSGEVVYKRAGWWFGGRRLGPGVDCTVVAK